MAIRGYSMALGATVGVFMQLSTLGVNFLVLSATKTSPKADIFALPLAYSFLTLTFALALLAIVRQILSAVLSGRQHDNVVHNILVQLECRFIMGALLGVCSSWIVTDVALGMQRQITFAACIFIAALAFSYFLKDSEERAEEVETNEESDEDIATEYQVMVV